jgi:hypothetical protein
VLTAPPSQRAGAAARKNIDKVINLWRGQIVVEKLQHYNAEALHNAKRKTVRAISKAIRNSV